ncbi:MAG: hypothetical protein MUE34_15750, partial [Acidimicrobiales bacterium]|nr:hypothetical protein [Acidimicrobiales bacterium]
MNPRRLATAAALLAGLGLATAPARADLGPGLRISLTGIDGPATAGQPVSFGVLIETGHEVVLSGFQLSGGNAAGTGTVATGLPSGRFTIAPGSPSQFTLTTTPSIANPVYRLRFSAGNRVVDHYFDLSRAHFDRMFEPQLAAEVGDVPLPAVDPGADADPGPGPEPAPAGLLTPVRDLRQERPRDGLQGRNVQIKVRVGYQRDDNQWIGADRLTVRVLDRETGPSDDLLYEGRTGSDGRFDATVWSDENQPDLYLEFRTLNGAVDVQDGTWSSTYKWETGVKEDFTGGTADFGTRTPSDEKIRIALHLLTNVTRAWRWVYQTTGFDVPRQAVEWPSGDWPHYDPFGGDIHIPENIGGSKNLSRAWATDTHIHEFGHALQNEVFDYMAPFDYDNGVCNNPNGDPGHCAWCQEDGGTALNEGWGNYLADQVLSGWEAKYGIAPNKTRNQENLSACLDNQDPAMSCACDPYRTEGHFGRLLRDLTDDTPDEIDPLGTPNGQDLGAYGAGAVFQVMDAAKPQSPAAFIQQFLLFHALPAPGIYWSTLANNDYLLDDDNPPGVPPGLTSTDHAIGVANPDATITMVWDPAGDDFSGVDRYQLQRRTAPSGTWLPAYEGPALTYTSLELDAGWYDFRIRAFDRAGNASPYGQLGSFGIRDPYPADLTHTTPSGWDGNVVARSANDATSTDCTVTPTLPGGTLGTYVNWAVRNGGEQTTETSHITSLRIDGASALSSTIHVPLSAAGTQQARNRGPYTVRGGRHTLEAVYDAGEDNIEISETNNRRGRQFTWLGEKVNIAQRVRRPAPPDPTGGHSSFSVPIGQTKFKNCDGLYYSHLRTSPTIWTFDWAALWVAPLGAADDYDAMLHLHSTGTEDGGYTNGLATSSRPAGELDAVITQRGAGQQWDVGVINDNMGDGDYLASMVVSAITPLAVGDSAVITLGDSLFMAMRELTVPAGSAKTLVEVEITSGNGPLYTLWLDDTFTYGTISTYEGKVGTDAQGRSKLTVTSSAAADHGL